MIAAFISWIPSLVCILWNVLVALCTQRPYQCGYMLTSSCVHLVDTEGAFVCLTLDERAQSYFPYISTLIQVSHFPFMTSFLMCFLSQHNYKAGEGLGEGGPPAERDLRGLCALPVAHPAGKPWAGAAHWRYRCSLVHFFLQTSPTTPLALFVLHRLPHWWMHTQW